MTEHTELLAMILPPQGRLVVAAAASAGHQPGPTLVLALEHKMAAGSQTVAGLLDVEQVRLLRDGLDLWLRAAARGDVQAKPDATTRLPGLAGGLVGTADEQTVARWLASGADEARA
jgi:hypothetical protein